jgi:hypothetical protein
VTYLIREPHRREELAKYFVQNAHYDEVGKKVYFLQSSIPPQLLHPPGPTSDGTQTKHLSGGGGTTSSMQSNVRRRQSVEYVNI